MRKRCLSCLLAVLLLFALAGQALAARTCLTIRAPKQLPQAGESFTVNVALSGNPGLTSAQWTLEFNSAVVECTDVSAGALLENALTATNPASAVGAKLAAASASAIEGDGIAATYIFKVKKSGNAAFALSSVELTDAEGGLIACEIALSAQESVTPPAGTQTGTASGFADMKTHWATDYVERAAALGLFKGYPDGKFYPDASVTRAQFVTVLYRMAGSPAVKDKTPFRDISGQSEEFRTAIAWAYGKSLISGRTAKTFDPDAAVTRQEAMKILFQYAGGKSGMEKMFTAAYDEAFTDSGSVAPWAKDAVYWAYYNGLITGTTDKTLTPAGSASRGQLAKILVIYTEKFGV